MKIKNRLLVCIWLPTLFLSSCDLLSERNQTEKAYHAEILWEREVNNISSYERPLIEVPYCYLATYENYPGGDPIIVKINIETGRVEWETRGFIG